MLIDQILKHYTEQEKDREWSNGIRPSNAGKCTRAIAYQYHGFEPEPLSSRARLVFRLGHLIEQDLTEVSLKLGLKDVQKKVTLTLCGIEIEGSIDGTFEDMVVDFKSINTRGFQETLKGSDKGYGPQLMLYMKALGLKKGLLVFYNKDTSALNEVLVNYDEEVVEEIEKKFAKVLNSTKEKLPDRDFLPSSTGKLYWACSYCSFNKLCYPNAQVVFDKANKPQYFV